MELMSKFQEVKEEILKTLKKSPLDFEPVHAKLVHKWVLVLKPDASEALQIAALSHDIDRAITGITERDLDDFSKIDDFKKEHSLRSAKFISEILTRYNYNQEVIDKVSDLVSKHEFGGDEESDILKDADSIAYFEYNIPSYLKRNGRDRAKEKIKFMYKRSPDKVKEIVEKLEFSDEVSSLVQEAILEVK